MDSAKNKKSFPDFGTDTVGQTPERSFAAFGAPKANNFALPESFWDAIQSDPGLKKEFDRRVEVRAAEYIEKEAMPQKQAIFEAARREGFDKGMSEGRDEIHRACSALEKVSEAVLAEKQKLLHGHETIWCEAMGHVLKRFLVPLRQERLDLLKTWLEECIGDFDRQAKIQVALSPANFALAARSTEVTPHWEWIEDKTLSEMDLRVNLVGGGVFFSPKQEWDKFEVKLNEVLGAIEK